MVEGQENDDLQFQALEAPAASAAMPALSDPFTLRASAPFGEPTNGVDDDGDGVIDERDVVLVRPAMPAEVLVTGVTGFGLVLENRTLRLTAEVSRRVPGGRVIRELSAKTVEVRND